MHSKFARDLLRRAQIIIKNDEPELAEKFLKVPLEYYTSNEFVAPEKVLLETTPLAVCHISQVANPFDYVTTTAFEKSLLITRNAEGVARVFLNFCRHRGAQPAKGCGNQRRFTCPYHAWTYDINGRLISMPAKDRYTELHFDEMGLVELPSEERHGFIWAVLTPGAEIDVAAHLGVLDDEIGSWGYAGYRFIDPPQQVELECNWKAVAEAFNESWHSPVVHAKTFSQYSTTAGMAPDLAGYDSFGPHMRWFAISPRQLRRDYNEDEPSDTLNVRDYVSVIYKIFPNLTLSNGPAAQGGTIYSIYYPGKTPLQCILVNGYLVPDTEKDRENVEFHRARSAESTQAVVEEDGVVLSSCGRGFRSGSGYAVIGRNEKGLQIIVENFANRIGCSLSGY
jgi:phenylpropionate dioxygenase-like ring-hydroxylating dioxygenase large terminal subunit